ncbi:hypothetical protein ABZ832_03325 [Streptantibioticus parmotrematis]|uniref:hypothetical protein n=1 Tax=Streptantibioticus parmotrematis TaxID=2873249 RepID=UPI0033E36A6C
MNDQDTHLQLSGRVSYEEDITAYQASWVIGFVAGTPGVEVRPSRIASPPAATPTPAAPTPPALAPASPSKVGPPDEPSGAGPPQITDIRQALEVSGASTIAEKIVAFAAYRQAVEREETFTKEDMVTLFRRAREASPSHLPREIGRAVLNGWITETSDSQYYLLAKGQEAFEKGFRTSGRKRNAPAPRSRSTGRRRSRPLSTPEVFAEIDHIPTTADGVPPYHQIPLKRDKALWALYLAKSLGIPGLQNMELVWLTDKLGDGIPSSDINGHFRGLHRHGYVNRSVSDHSMRITTAGEGYLRGLSSLGE